MSGDNLPDLAHFWIRCHLPLQNLQGVSHPAIAIDTGSAYDAFIGGVLAGKNGNLSTGDFSNDAYRIFPVPSPASAAAVIALRLTHRSNVDHARNLLHLSLGRPTESRGAWL